MGVSSFLSALFDEGRVRVGADDPLGADATKIDTRILAIEREYRDDLPGTPPEISLQAARYGAVTLYRACQYLVFRDVEPDMIKHGLNSKVGCSLTPSTHYSADLTLRYLPDVVRLAGGESDRDPLVRELILLAGRWPLSAVGIVGAEVGDITAITSDDCLLRIYVDRIIARQDYHRLDNLRVRDAACQAVGAFGELAPGAAAWLSADDRRQSLEEETE